MIQISQIKDEPINDNYEQNFKKVEEDLEEKPLNKSMIDFSFQP